LSISAGPILVAVSKVDANVSTASGMRPVARTDCQVGEQDPLDDDLEVRLTRAKPAKEGRMRYRLEVRSELKMRSLKYALDQLVDEVIEVEQLVEPPKKTCAAGRFDEPKTGSVQSIARRSERIVAKLICSGRGIFAALFDRFGGMSAATCALLAARGTLDD
jgi:hypothetical protein